MYHVPEVVDDVEVALNDCGVKIGQQAHELGAVLALREELGHLAARVRQRQRLPVQDARQQQDHVQHALVERVQEANLVVEPHGQRAHHQQALVALQVVVEKARHGVLGREIHGVKLAARLEDELNHVLFHAEDNAIAAGGQVVEVVVNGRKALVLLLEIGRVHVLRAGDAQQRGAREVAEVAQHAHVRNPAVAELELPVHVVEVDLVAQDRGLSAARRGNRAPGRVCGGTFRECHLMCKIKLRDRDARQREPAGACLCGSREAVSSKCTRGEAAAARSPEKTKTTS
nr:MAG: hypothetical protein [Molluscum contagiosum virus]